VRLTGRNPVALLVVATIAVLTPAVLMPAVANADDGSPLDGVVYVARTGTGACQPLNRTLTGTVSGTDGRQVDAFLGLDLLDGRNHPVDGHGCASRPGYGMTVHVNYMIPAQGAAPGTVPGAVTTWSIQLPANVTKVYLDGTPKQKASRAVWGATDTSHYGQVFLSGLHIHGGTNGPANVVLPTADCHAKFATGTLTGRFLDHGRPARGVRLSIFSAKLPGPNALVSGPGGMAIWNGNATSYTVRMLASGPGKGQPYTVLARLANGRTKTFVMQDRKHQFAGIQPCRVTRFDLRF
jgi:hypothetical protein